VGAIAPGLTPRFPVTTVGPVLVTVSATTAKVCAVPSGGAVAAIAEWNGTAVRSVASKTMAASLANKPLNVCVRTIRFFIVCLLWVTVKDLITLVPLCFPLVSLYFSPPPPRRKSYPPAQPGVYLIIKITPENPVLWTGMKGASAESRRKTNQMLKQVQHDMTVRFWSFRHPEPSPELNSGSTISGSLFWV